MTNENRPPEAVISHTKAARLLSVLQEDLPVREGPWTFGAVAEAAQARPAWLQVARKRYGRATNTLRQDRDDCGTPRSRPAPVWAIDGPST